MGEKENTENTETSHWKFLWRKKKLVLNFWKLFWNQNDSPLSESAQISMEFPPHLLVCSPAVCPQSLAASQTHSIAAFQGLLKTACSSAASCCSRSSKDWSADEDKPWWDTDTVQHENMTQEIAAATVVAHTLRKFTGIWVWNSLNVLIAHYMFD